MSIALKAETKSPYLTDMNPVTGMLDPAGDRKKGLELREQYQAASPFPHIVLDDFLPPEILDRCLAEFPSNLATSGASFDRDQERYKSQFMPDDMTPWLRALFYGFNSRPFITLLQNITGISGLIPDPYFLGAGFHEIGQGGHLSVHADFNHHKPMNLERRINVLIYLNRDWPLSYGGGLELWDLDMKNCVVSAAPAFNRGVIFNTTSDSWHGNPAPVNHPAGKTRKSIALYYYTATWDDTKRTHTTQFKVRPESADKTDWKVGMKELAADLLPPMIYRRLRRGARKDG